MELTIWYCPKFDKPTHNWRICELCNTQAVYQRFVLWPVALEKPEPPDTRQRLGAKCQATVAELE